MKVGDHRGGGIRGRIDRRLCAFRDLIELHMLGIRLFNVNSGVQREGQAGHETEKYVPLNLSAA